MVSSDLGACEWFVWDLRRSGLIDRGQLDTIVGEFLRRNPRAEAPALAEHLVDQATLTPFQAERVLNGKTQGLVLGPYVLLDSIGSGSMGQVYRASSKNDSSLYAVKVLPRRSMWNVRLARRQVRSFANFSNPAVVPFVDVGTAGGLHYLVWPLAEGTTLEQLIQESGKLAPNLTALLGTQIAQGLAEAHQNGLFHGLIKPSNILVGSDNQAHILDFGIGSLLVENEGESLVDTMSTANTLTSGLDCASPESIMDPTNRTPAGDQYSLGCTLYYCLTGRVPFPEGSAVEKMMAHQTKEPASIAELAPNVPAGLVAVVRRLMDKDPDSRFTVCDELVEALRSCIGDPNAILGGAPGRKVSRTSGIGGSSGRMPGIGNRPGSGSASRMSGLPPREPPATPTPGLPTRGSAGAPADRSPATRTPPPAPARPGTGLPNRASLQLSANAEAAAAVPKRGQVATTPPPVTRAARKEPTPEPELVEEETPASWFTEEPVRASSGGTNVGPIGLVCVALILMIAVYFGAMLLMKQ